MSKHVKCMAVGGEKEHESLRAPGDNPGELCCRFFLLSSVFVLLLMHPVVNNVSILQKPHSVFTKSVPCSNISFHCKRFSHVSAVSSSFQILSYIARLLSFF